VPAHAELLGRGEGPLGREEPVRDIELSDVMVEGAEREGGLLLRRKSEVAGEECDPERGAEAVGTEPWVETRTLRKL
jgi:hypothetical protein